MKFFCCVRLLKKLSRSRFEAMPAFDFRFEQGEHLGVRTAKSKAGSSPVEDR
jgi:hypothetical protein